MSGPYNPASALDRGRLAHELVRQLEAAGFTPSKDDQGEIVYQRQVSRPVGQGRGRTDLAGVLVLVWTSIPPRGALAVRESGKDAIRVCSVYRSDDRSFGLAKETRVNRTGTIENIVDRTLERARSTWRAALDRPTCSSCGAITFVAKTSKRDVCAALCFKRETAHSSAH